MVKSIWIDEEDGSCAIHEESSVPAAVSIYAILIWR